jgi:spore coat-associated protein N
MKKIIGLTVAALMVMGLVGGGTWAYFSDTETIGENILLGGTLDLGLSLSSGGDPTGSLTGTFDTSGFAPGDTIGDIIYVNNEGSIDMTSVNISFAHAGIVNGTPGSVDAGPGGNTDELDRMLTASTATWNGSSIGAIAGQSLYDLVNTVGSVDLGALPADTEVPLNIIWTFSTTATNGCQGDSVNMTITLDGRQQ